MVIREAGVREKVKETLDTYKKKKKKIGTKESHLGTRTKTRKLANNIAKIE